MTILKNKKSDIETLQKVVIVKNDAKTNYSYGFIYTNKNVYKIALPFIKYFTDNHGYIYKYAKNNVRIFCSLKNIDFDTYMYKNTHEINDILPIINNNTKQVCDIKVFNNY